jgi:CBS-domain-containing membrane protein
LIPLLSTRPRLAQAALVIGGPVLFGALCGFLLGASKSAYLLASVLSIAGGFLAGFEHPGAGEGALRGLIGGTLFGSFILIAHEIDGRAATSDLPHPGILLVAVTLCFGALLGALGGMMRRRAEPAAPAS